MKYFLIVFLSLLFTNFFGATTVSNMMLLFMILPFVVIEFPKKSLFKGYLIIFIIALLLNMISCYHFNQQPLWDSFKALNPYLYILFYFVLKELDFPVAKMEKALVVLTIIFCICYIIQFIIYPIAIFSGAKAENFNDVRIRLAGQGFSSLGYFLGLNKYLRTNKKAYLLLSFLCFGVIFLMGFRTMLAMIIFVSLIMIVRLNGISWKFFWYSIIIGVLLIVVIQIPVFAERVESMLVRQETEVFSNPDYVRVIQFVYFTQNHFKNIVEYIFGSGLPYWPDKGATGEYAAYMYQIATEKKLNWVDLGLLAQSWVIGIPAVAVMIFYAVKAICLKVDPDYYYLGLWFFYLLISSFTTAEFFRTGNFVVQAIVLFSVEKANGKFIFNSVSRLKST
jgi:hypothetical protein